MELYQNVDRFPVALDCIIFGFDEDGLKLLLIKRNFEPEKGKWSLMGGFLRKDEHLRDAAKRILHDLTGLENIYLEQLKTFGKIDRDPVERTISVIYYSLINIKDHKKKLLKKHGAEWFSISKLPNLIFDHNKMVEEAKHILKYKASSQPVGFELLPDKFTMPQLQSLYEAIYESQLDKRNFRKKIMMMDILIKLNEKEKSSSKRGAYYYIFDKKKYENLIQNGYSFEI